MTALHEPITVESLDELTLMPFNGREAHRGLNSGAVFMINTDQIALIRVVIDEVKTSFYKQYQRIHIIDCDIKTLIIDSGTSHIIDSPQIDTLHLKGGERNLVLKHEVNSLTIDGYLLETNSRLTKLISERSLVSLNFLNCKIKDFIPPTSAKVVRLISCTFEDVHLVHFSNLTTYTIAGCDIQKRLLINFEIDQVLETLNIKDLRLPEDATLDIDEVILGEFEAYDLKGAGTVQMENILVRDFLSFIDMKVHSVELYDVDLGSAMVNAQGVHIDTLAYRDVQFSFDIERFGRSRYDHYLSPDKINRYNEISRFAGLMEHFAIKAGDKAWARKWHKLHLQANRLHLTWSDNWQDKLNLTLSEVISDYGQSWARPLYAIWVISGLYWIQLFTVKEAILEIHPIPWGEFYWSSYLQFFLPTRPYNSLGLDNPIVDGNLLYRLIDIVSRILQAYVIYHFLRATRKFV